MVTKHVILFEFFVLHSLCQIRQQSGKNRQNYYTKISVFAVGFISKRTLFLVGIETAKGVESVP